jgi:hypothetical protein
VRLQERPAAAPVLVVRGPVDAFASWLLRGTPGTDLERAGRLHIEGDRSTWKALARAFGSAGSDSPSTKEIVT